MTFAFHRLFRPVRIAFLAAVAAVGISPLSAQSTFSPFKITLFEDASLLSSKGIMNFQNQRAEIPVTMSMIPESIDLVAGTSEVKVVYYRLRQDSMPSGESVGTWGEVLQANMGKRMTIVYDAGIEVDEVNGEPMVVNTDSGMLLLKGSEDSQYFIPFAEIKQVIVLGNANFLSPKKVSNTILELGIDKDMPFVPMEMHSLHDGIRWTPVGRIRITGPEKAVLQQTAVIQNDLADFQDIDLELCASKILSDGHQNGDIVPAGKLTIKKGERLAMGLKDTELPYTAAYQCVVPWTTPLMDGNAQRFPVQNIMRFNATSLPGLQCESYHIIDENNRQLAQLPLTSNEKTGQLELMMGEEKAVIVTVLERVVKRSNKVEQIGELSYTRVSMECKINLFNAGQKFAQLQVQRDIKGTVTLSDKAKVEDSPLEPNVKSLIWKFSLEKGSKKEVTYTYDAFVPVGEK